jgi:hypothetical protein
MLQWLHALSFVPLAVAARLRRIERHTIARLHDAGANAATRGILLDRTGRLNAFVFRRLHRAGAIQDAGNDRYYLDARAYETFRARRRRRALVVMVALLLLVAGLFLGGTLS